VAGCTAAAALFAGWDGGAPAIAAARGSGLAGGIYGRDTEGLDPRSFPAEPAARARLLRGLTPCSECLRPRVTLFGWTCSAHALAPCCMLHGLQRVPRLWPAARRAARVSVWASTCSGASHWLLARGAVRRVFFTGNVAMLTRLLCAGGRSDRKQRHLLCSTAQSDPRGP